MKKLLLLFTFSISFYFTNAQEIYITKYKNDADYIVYITNEKSISDWVIKKTLWRNQAKDGVWYFTEWKNNAEVIIFITKEKSDADKIVYYTEWSTDIKFSLE